MVASTEKQMVAHLVVKKDGKKAEMTAVSTVEMTVAEKVDKKVV